MKPEADMMDALAQLHGLLWYLTWRRRFGTGSLDVESNTCKRVKEVTRQLAAKISQSLSRLYKEHAAVSHYLKISEVTNRLRRILRDRALDRGVLEAIVFSPDVCRDALVEDAVSFAEKLDRARRSAATRGGATAVASPRKQQRPNANDDDFMDMDDDFDDSLAAANASSAANDMNEEVGEAEAEMTKKAEAVKDVLSLVVELVCPDNEEISGDGAKFAKVAFHRLPSYRTA